MKFTFDLVKDNVELFYETVNHTPMLEICIPFVAGRLLHIPKSLEYPESEIFNKTAPTNVRLEVSTKQPKKKGWVKVEYKSQQMYVSGRKISYPGILMVVKAFMSDNGMRKFDGSFCVWLKATKI